MDETPPSFKIISESACSEDLTSINCNTERWSFQALVNDNGTGMYIRTMCDFHNFGLIFTGQCTVCLKG